MARPKKQRSQRIAKTNEKFKMSWSWTTLTLITVLITVLAYTFLYRPDGATAAYFAVNSIIFVAFVFGIDAVKNLLGRWLS